MKSTRLLIIAAACLIAVSVSARSKTAAKTIPASSEGIVYVGRTEVTDSIVSLSWSGVYCHVRFTGPSLSMNCSSDGKALINVWRDRSMSAHADAVETIRLSDTTACLKDTTIILAQGLGKGEHEVIFQKRTEGSQGALKISGFTIEGDLLQASTGRERLIEFIGDSYTCGFGTENSVKTDPFTPETENCNYAYGCIIARYFGADYRLLSHSGIGAARNYGDGTGKTMVDRYGETLDADFEEEKDLSWDFSSARHPDVVVIYLGTNDFSRGKQPKLSIFCQKYKAIIDQVKNAYGEEVPVVCMASKIDETMGYYVKTAAENCGHRNVAWLQLGNRIHNDEDELGASYHPNYKGQKKVAMNLIPYISTVTGWELENKVIE